MNASYSNFWVSCNSNQNSILMFLEHEKIVSEKKKKKTPGEYFKENPQKEHHLEKGLILRN